MIDKKLLNLMKQNSCLLILSRANVVNFKDSLIKEQKKRLEEKSINCEIIDINEIKNLESCYCLYPTVGENLDYINQNSLKNIEFLYRKLDQNSWKFCNKGFFNFKKYIPKIVENLE